MDVSTFFAYPDAPARRAVGFLGALHEDEVATILSVTQSRRYARGDMVLHEGERDRTLYIVTHGRFEAVAQGERGPQRARLFQPGDIFGELAFFDDEPRSAAVRAVEDAEALLMTPAGFERLRLAEPRLAFSFVLDLGRILSLRYREYHRRLMALGEL